MFQKSIHKTTKKNIARTFTQTTPDSTPTRARFYINGHCLLIFICWKYEVQHSDINCSMLLQTLRMKPNNSSCLVASKHWKLRPASMSSLCILCTWWWKLPYLPCTHDEKANSTYFFRYHEQLGWNSRFIAVQTAFHHLSGVTPPKSTHSLCKNNGFKPTFPFQLVSFSGDIH